MFGLGAPELLLIFLVALLFFGAKRLPELAQGLGKSIREFKKAMRETEDELKDSMKIESPKDNAGAKPNDAPRKDTPPTVY